MPHSPSTRIGSQPAWTGGARLALAAGSLMALAACGGGGGGGGGGEAPAAGAELSPLAVLTDGAPQDAAADDDTVWIASGRRLAVLDAATLERLPQQESELPTTLRAVELDPATQDLLMLDEQALYRRSPSSAPEELLWSAPPGAKLNDLALGGGHALVLGTQSLYDLVLAGGTATLQHELPLVGGSTLRAYAAADGWIRAAVVAQTFTGGRFVNGLVLAGFSPEGDALPTLAPIWLPEESSPLASVESVLLLPDPAGLEDRAWVAAGMRGSGDETAPYVEVLDVTASRPPVHLAWIDLQAEGDRAAHELAFDPEGGRVFVCTDARLLTVGAGSLATLGALPASFRMDRSAPVLQHYPLGLRLWTVERQPLEHNLRIFDVTGDTPELSHEGWWWVGSDAAVYAPGWHSLYLTTFGGVVRYDVSDPAQPALVGGHFPEAGGTSYQAASKVTEDAELLEAGAASRLLVARGYGGFDAFPVSADAPNPGPPTTVPTTLPFFLYNNAVAVWQSPSGVRYALTDATTTPPTGPRYHLEAARYDPDDGSFTWVAATVPVAPPSEIKTPITSNLAVAGHFAFVGARGMFFVVDLSKLPGALPIADLVTVAEVGGGDVFVRGIAPSAEHLFVSIRGDGAGDSVFAVYGYDAATGDVTEQPLATVQAGDAGVPPDFALFDHARLTPDKQTVVVCGSQGRLFAFDVSDPLKPFLSDTWQSPGLGITTDCRVETFTFPGGEQRPLAVFVNMAETFKLLELE